MSLEGPVPAPGPRDGPVPVRHRIAAARWRLVGAALVLGFYALMWIAVVAGATALAAPLITLPVLLVLVAAGNWLQHWLGISRASPRSAPRAPGPGEPPAPR